MKRNAKTLIAGMVALAMTQSAFAKDIKVAVIGALSGPVAQWGDMEFNGARQAIKATKPAVARAKSGSPRTALVQTGL